MKRRALAILAAGLLAVAGTTHADDDAPDRAELEEQFAAQLSGSQLVGQFTTDGEDEAPAAPDKYTIKKVTKLPTGYWRFDALIQYQGKDQEFRMPVPIEWAGDTPVVTLTNVLVPGSGTFTARVLFYGDRYAGTWEGAGHGGHMYGRVVKADADEGDEGDQ